MAEPTYLGADAARSLITFLEDPTAADQLTLPAPGRPGLALRRPSGTSPTGTSPTGTPLSGTPLLDRYELRLAPAARQPVHPAPPALPPGVLVITNSPAALTAADLPADAVTVLVDGSTVLVTHAGRPVAAESFGDLVGSCRPAHVRVLVDATDPALWHAGWSPAARTLLALHEWMFAAAHAGAEHWDEHSSLLVVLAGGVRPDGTPNPFTGLFGGFVKSLALELPSVPVVATVHDTGDLAAALAVAVPELGARQLLPVVYHRGGDRLTTRAVRSPAVATQAPVTGDSLVLAAGGGRGIGAALLTELARRHRPRIVLLGSTDLAGVEPELLAVDENTAATGRSAFIAGLTTGPDRISVAEANRRFERLQAARAVHATLVVLRRHCGADRVSYLRCDLRDTDAVRQAVATVHAEHGTVDLLLNVAGTNRAAAVGSKSAQDFAVVRDLKLHTYLNLRDAFAGRPPRRWCNFGSFVGFTGQHGETDYGSANDFLNTAAAAGTGEFTIGWTLWRDIGLGAGPVMRAFLAKSNQFTATPTEEGIAHFLAELGQPNPAPASVLFGEKERAAIAAAVPDYLDFCASEPAEPIRSPLPAAAEPVLPAAVVPAGLPFVDDVLRHSDTELTVLRTFDLDRDGYLDLHRVHGYPTLPGTFVPELAAEAAVTLVPDRVPVVFEDLRLESFLRVYPNATPTPKRITARLSRSDETESVVTVRVLTDVHAPDGRVLAKDRLHFSVTVRLRDQPVASPRWAHWDAQDEHRLIDPYHVPDSAALLRGVFVSTTDTRTHPLGRRADAALDGAAVRRWFPDLLLPSVLLDGLARVSVLERIGGRWTPVAVPRTVRRIDVYGRHTDRSLAEGGAPVGLYSLPTHLDLEAPVADNRAVAVLPDGSIVLQLKDMTGAVLGYVDQETGSYVDRVDLPPDARDALRERTSP